MKKKKFKLILKMDILNIFDKFKMDILNLFDKSNIIKFSYPKDYCQK